MNKSILKALALLVLVLAVAPPAWSQSITTDGNIETDSQLVSKVPPGTAPLAVSSSTLVPSLNADLLDSMESSAFAQDSDLQNVETLLVALQEQVDALTLPDPPCFDNATRFVNCSNGTVTDTTTGLIWLEDTNCFAAMNFSAANDTASVLAEGQCSLTDGSRPGDWRLPTRQEWEALARPSCPKGPKIDGNGASFGCYTDSPWASGVQVDSYWSSTTSSATTTIAWLMNMNNGIVNNFFLKTGTKLVWPVRSGRGGSRQFQDGPLRAAADLPGSF